MQMNFFSVRWFLLVAWVCLNLSFKYLYADDALQQQLQEWKESRVQEAPDGWYFPFEADEDSNRFPDHWSRSKNYKLADGHTLAYASWAEVKLDSRVKKSGKNSLFILSEGAQPISLETGIFKINNYTAFELSGWFNLEEESTSRTKLVLGVHWYDSDHQLLPKRTEDSFSVISTSGWELKKQRINRIDTRAAFAQLYLLAEGEDKAAKIWVDDVRFTKRPLVLIETNKFLHTFEAKEPIVFTVRIQGFEKSDSSLVVEIFDVLNHLVYTETRSFQLSPSEIAEKKEIALTIQPKDQSLSLKQEGVHEGFFRLGVFRVNVILKQGTEEIGGSSVRIARTQMKKRDRIKDDGEVFGVTVEDINTAYALRNGLDLMTIQRVKIPVWHDTLEWDKTQFKADATRERLLETIKSIRTGENQPEIVGVFAPRPRELEDLAEVGFLNLVRADETKWKPFIENDIFALRTNIKAWQLGADDDSSFTNDEQQQAALERLNVYLEKAGVVGASTKILNSSFIKNKKLLPHRWLMFHNFEYTNDFSFTKLAQALPEESEQFSVKKWLTISLPSRLDFINDYGVAVELFKKVVTARSHHIKRIFISKYQDEFAGLLNHKDEVTPAFLVAKLCAERLSDVSYIGSLPEFGDEIQNFVFSLNQDPKKAILIAWTKRSDDPNRSYSFTDATLLKENTTLNDLIAELNQPDVLLNRQITDFFPNLNEEVNKPHIEKGLNTILDTPEVRKRFLTQYSKMAQLSQSPYLRSLLQDKIKSENEEKESVRLILEELYSKSLFPIEQIKKKILLDQEIHQIDLMGNVAPVPIKWLDGDPYQNITISQDPSIFTGLSRDFINTRISIKLDPEVKLYSRLERQKQSIIIQNHYDQPMEGIFVINYPPSWKNFNPFIKFRLEKGEKKTYDFYIIPSRIATPGTIQIGLKTTFHTDRKYSFFSNREANLISDLIIGRPGEKVEIMLPKFGEAQDRYTLNLPISLKPTIANRPAEVDLVVTLILPDGDTMQARIDKVQPETFRTAGFSIQMKKEYNNKSVRVKIEQRGSEAESLIFHNIDIPIPDIQ